MAVESGPLSGFRDMLAEQMLPRQQMIDTIKKVYESYGFTPLDTPAIERLETLMGKYGEEGEKLIYHVQSKGDRKLALRYDLTVPLARVVAQHRNEITLPYKRYQVANVWRGESPQAGRFREFMQFDADIVGTKSVLSDAEVVAMMSDNMQALDVNALIRVNNRRILDGLVTAAGGEKDTTFARDLVRVVDKVEKIGAGNAVNEIAVGFNDQIADLVSDYLRVEGTPLERVKALQNLLKNNPDADEGFDNLNLVFEALKSAGYGEDKIVFDQTIARGLNYYTGIIYESTLVDLPKIGSVCSGGRFDHLVEQMGGPDLPAVGTSIGVDRLFAGLEELGKIKKVKTQSQVLIANFGNEFSGSYLKIASRLRQMGVASEIYYDDDKIAKQIRLADQLGIKYMILMGPDEISTETIQLRDLTTRQQQQIPLDELLNISSQKTGRELTSRTTMDNLYDTYYREKFSPEP